MKQVPFWVDDFPRPEGLTSELPASTEYLIVGSGLTGLSAALRLSDAGREVTVVDGGEIASGASSINGGMVSPDVKAGMRAVENKYGPELATEMWDATVRSVEIVDELDRIHGLDAVIARGGMTGLALTTRDQRRVSEQVTWYNERFGTQWKSLDRDEVEAVVGGSQKFEAGLYEPEGIGVHPARFAFGLASAARQEGVALVEGTMAESIEESRTGYEIATTTGRVKAGTVIVATNGYTTQRPLPKLARLVVPVGSYIIVTEPLGEAAVKAIFPTNSMSYTRKRLLNYMRRTHDHRILIGGRRNLRTNLDLEESADDLRRKLSDLWPSLGDAAITHVWGGKLGVPFDLIPHIGRIGGVWYALGYAGHGVGLATLLGHDLAGMLLGDTPSVFSRIPHIGRFYYRGRPWFLGPASILYRTSDRLGR